MDSKEKQYKELFIGETLNNLSELNNLLTSLEKNIGDKNIVDAIFRIIHTLKGNAAGLGFEEIAELSHIFEDLFEAIKHDKIKINENNFNDLFRTVDLLGNLTNSLKTGKKVSYKGMKTKLEVFLKNQLKYNTTAPSEEEPLPLDKKIKDQVLPKAKTTTKKTSTKTTNKKSEDPTLEAPPPVINKTDNPKIDFEPIETEITFSDMVQIPVRKLDNLLNLVGELTIERDRLAAIQSEINNEFALLNRISSDLQYSVMDVRLVQVGFVFSKFSRIVRDVANIETKKVNLKLEGTETEIDRNVLQVISDSLIHLVRNAVGHGIESPDERKKLKKQEEGTIILRARSERDSIIIEIEDDGKGIDTEIIKNKAIEKGILSSQLASIISEDETIMFIFEPGFSSATEVNSISGRGVGMDVVKKAIESIGGNINVTTKKGEGTTIALLLPSSMTVKASLLLELGQAEYAIPLVYTEAVLSVKPINIFNIGDRFAIDYLGNTIALLSLKELLYGKNYDISKFEENAKVQVVVVSHNNFMFGLLVDKLLQQKEIVEKPLQNPLDKVKSISGVTILGNGNVCLVLNIPVIMNRFLNFSRKQQKING